jgi:ribose transport system substrate-binding protein
LPAINIAKAKAKGPIWLITCGGGNRFCENLGAGVQQAGAAAGIKTNVYTAATSGDNTVGIDEAISQHAGAIILVAVDPASVKAPLAAAKKAGIPVVSIGSNDPSDPPEPGVTADVTTSYINSGALNADYLIASQGSAANAYCMQTPILPGTVDVCNGFKAQLAKLCPKCQYSVGNYDPDTMAQNLQSGIQAAVSKDPSLNFVMCTFDAMCDLAVPAIKAIGKTSQISAGSQTGTLEPNLGWVRSGDVQVVDVGIPSYWNSWAGVDQALRLMVGAKPAPDAGSLPTKMFTHQSLAAQPKLNLTEGSGNTNEEAAYGTNGGALYRNVYLKLWGIKK